MTAKPPHYPNDSFQSGDPKTQRTTAFNFQPFLKIISSMTYQYTDLEIHEALNYLEDQDFNSFCEITGVEMNRYGTEIIFHGFPQSKISQSSFDNLSEYLFEQYIKNYEMA